MQGNGYYVTIKIFILLKYISISFILLRNSFDNNFKE